MKREDEKLEKIALRSMSSFKFPANALISLRHHFRAYNVKHYIFPVIR